MSSPEHGASDARDGAPERNREHERQTTYGEDSRHRAESFAIEDERWTRGAQLRDWGRLALMIGVFLLWTLLIYWLEPGLR